MDMSVYADRQVLTGHMDGHIRIWDMRMDPEEGAANMVSRVRASEDTVSTVCWSPTDPARFCTGNYAGRLRFWDIRSSSSIPLYELILTLDSQKPEVPERKSSEIPEEEFDKEYYVHTLHQDEEDKNDPGFSLVQEKWKVLAMDWKDRLYVGSEDSRVRIYHTADLGEKRTATDKNSEDVEQQ